MLVGIDLGTSNSLICIWENGKPVLIPNILNKVITPSVVGYYNKQIIVGEAAKDRLISYPDLTTSNFKRYMGTKKVIRLGKKTFLPEELSSFVIRNLIQDAEAYTREKVKEAIITVPAYFRDAQRKATKLAGELAGINVPQIINEPTAAALAYSLHEIEENTILIFDLGGGTFDISILDIFEGVIEVKSCSGNNFLGGEDFTEKIINIILMENGDRLPNSKLSPIIRQRIHKEAEKVKINLSKENKVKFELHLDKINISRFFYRDEFEYFCKPLLTQLSNPIEQAIKDSGLNPKDIDDIILVGGATKMPIIRELVGKMFNRLPRISLNPEEVVGIGAGIMAAIKIKHKDLKEKVLTDIAPFSLGIEITKKLSYTEYEYGIFSPIIERGTMIPVSRVHSFSTIEKGQKEIALKVYQGESRNVKDNILLGSLYIDLPINCRSLEQIDVRFTYDKNGILEVEALVLSNNNKFNLIIEENPGVLSKQEIKERLKILEKIKIHPLDTMDNVLLLAKAERLYEESLGEVREIIGCLINKFKSILSSQEQDKIRDFKEVFQKEISRLDKNPFL